MSNFRKETLSLNIIHQFDGQTYTQQVTALTDCDERGRIFSVEFNGVELHCFRQELLADGTYDKTTLIHKWDKAHLIDGLPRDNEDIFVKWGLDKHFTITPRTIKYFDQYLYSDVVPCEVVGRRGKTIYVLRKMHVENPYDNDNPIITPNKEDYPTHEIRVGKGKRVGHDINSDGSIYYCATETPHSYRDPNF